jgi:hypothetical protein
MGKCPNPQCNTQIQPGNLFCGSCGMDLSLDSTPATHTTFPTSKPRTSPRRLFILAGSLLGLLILIGGGIFEIFQNQLDPPAGFTLTGVTLNTKQHIAYHGQTLSLRNTDTPFAIQGTDLSEGSGLVWVLLGDVSGNYYLQTPSVLFWNSTDWTAENIRPENNITSVYFVAVTRAGNEEFQNKANQREFGAFTNLPQGSQILAHATLSTDTSHIR